MALFGEYNISMVGFQGPFELNISYRAGGPIVPNVVGDIAAACDLALGRLENTDFANPEVERDGVAQLFVGAIVPDEDGMLQINIRNTLTFNRDGGL